MQYRLTSSFSFFKTEANVQIFLIYIYLIILTKTIPVSALTKTPSVEIRAYCCTFCVSE